MKTACPSEEEMKAAVLACCGRHCKACETPVAYALRKRDVDMEELLRLAIENELSQNERAVITLYWFSGFTQAQIAEDRGIDVSTVCRTLERAKQKLYSVLRYAVFYQQNTNRSNIIPGVISRARAVHAARLFNSSCFSEEIGRQRIMQNLTPEQVEEYAGLEQGRASALENGVKPTDEEKVRLCAFYAILPDELLKGENDDLRQITVFTGS